ncbi:MAG TPA: hypothetical protein VFI68_08290, partial [Anaerolineales bacterium]|nr:hypothetical protein [Anaerolineales bacterium]
MNIPSIKKQTIALILAVSVLLLTTLILIRKAIFLGGLGNIILLITAVAGGLYIITVTRNIAKNKSASVVKNSNLPDHLGEMLHRAILETSTDSFAVT